MHEYRQAIVRMRLGDTDRGIAHSGLMGRKKAAQVRGVAQEQGWSAKEFLTQCCATKAGLAPDAWKDPETEVSLFAAEVIRESSIPGSFR